jgi:hypothetical protein
MEKIMAKGKANPDWKKLVLEWRASGKSSKDWCEKNKIPNNTLSGWKKRLKKLELNNDSINAKTGFIELKNRELSDSGISLECNGVKIHLKTQFDSSVLKQCLNCLRGD